MLSGPSIMCFGTFVNKLHIIYTVHRGCFLFEKCVLADSEKRERLLPLEPVVDLVSQTQLHACQQSTSSTHYSAALRSRSLVFQVYFYCIDTMVIRTPYGLV